MAVWVNGVQTDQISALDRGLAYGDGLFATMRVSGSGTILMLEHHLLRLSQGAARIGIKWSPSDKLQAQLQHLAALHPGQCLKLVLTRGCGGRGYQPPAEAKASEIISFSPVPAHYPRWQQQGVALASSEVRLGRQPLLAGIKHLNRLEQVLIRSQALPEWAQDWLVRDSDGLIIETSMANLFFVTEEEVLTPAITRAGVAGVTREQVIKALLALGYRVRCCDLDDSVLAQSRHVFLCNSLLGPVNVLRIDQCSYPPFEHTDSMRHMMDMSL
ncbi:aminodeoxychorismate lyase [Shewanella sedimentimangrovi]|uniref:Aminodeoxychorismate lyase n=1 Tax=Shewanella sedimentimangrovi TaxID=2814293 RepID=A0ABX7QXU6_9GAMM|nr:aminodeoxychorismate lyase [Shewanella sedimentimangrovi]QSX35741.1 aminodeoxychorismate lyase [Shewanella sedimentimangrovi]